MVSLNIRTDDVQQPLKYLKDQNILHLKQFGFRIGHSKWIMPFAFMSLHL